MTVVSAVVGAVTPTTARVVTKVTGGAAVRLAVADNQGMSGPVFHGPVNVDAQGVASLTATGLDPGTRYWYRIEDAGVLDPELQGAFGTHPVLGEPADFTFAASSCRGLDPTAPGVGDVLAPDRLSNHGVHTTIRAKDPLFFADLGDPCYYDLGSGQHGIVGGATVENFRRQDDDILAQPTQHDLFRLVPRVYVKDDHDGGGNDHDSTSNVEAFNQVYRERIPHYPLPAGGGGLPIYHSFPVARTLFIASDVRSLRSPNDDPQSPSKTMLGSSQKTWMEALLASSQEELLVWLMASQWMGTGSDTWASFTHERDELVQMFGDLGWLPRMRIVSGDVHALAIDTGTGNHWGGFPVYQFASLDSAFGEVQHQYDTGPSSPGRNRYGTVRIDDQGTGIEVTASGWIGTTLWRSHTATVGASTPPPPPGPVTPLPPVSVAKVTTRVTTLGCDLVTGRVIAELRDTAGEVSRVLGAYTSHEATVPIPLGGPAALGPLVFAATEPFRSMLVTVVNDVPIYAGIVLPQEGGTAAELRLGLVSLEGYLQYRFVRDHTWTQQDEAAVIAAGLVGDAGPIPGLAVGTGIDLIVDAPATGTLRDRTYHASDHKSVYEALQELMAVENGPEWTIDLDWSDTRQNRVVKIFRVRKRIGVASTRPRAVFRSNANTDATYSYLVDRGGGRYANVVQAYSSGEGDDQPTSALAVDTAGLAAGAPIVERHWQPSSSITSQATLDAHAVAELARRKDGARTFRVESRWNADGARYGLDWAVGDDVAYELFGHRHPAGVVGVARAVGFELNIQGGRIRPVLPEPAADGG